MTHFSGRRANARPWVSTCGAWRAILVAGIIGLGLILVLALPHDKVIHAEWMAALLWLAGPLAILELLRRRCRLETLASEDVKPMAGVLVLFGFALLYCFSSAANFKWFYFLDWPPPADSGLFNFNSGLGHFVLLTALCLPLFLFPSHRLKWLVAGMLILIQAAALIMFLTATRGQPLYNDDHPSFLYRLWVFGRCFPHLLNYSPVWNAGNLEMAGVSTGANAPGILFWPLWKYGSVPQFYSCAVGIMYILLVPSLAMASVRIMGFGRMTAWVAGLLALGISRYSLMWLLNYGTIGANFTSAFIMPASACLYRILVLNRMEKVTGLGLVLSMVFLWMWPPGLVMIIPLLLAFLVQVRHWSKQNFLFLMGCAAAAGVLCLYPLLLMLKVTDVVSHEWMRPQGSVGHFVQALLTGWEFLVVRGREANPLLVFLGIGGLLVAPEKELRKWFLPILAGFALLAGWGPECIPDLQLSRMAIPLFYVAVLPAAVLIARMLATQPLRLAILRAAAFSLLIMTGWNSAKLYAGEGEAGFAYTPPAIRRLVSWVKHHTARNDRILLAGGTGHLYEGGHVTALPVLMERELLSSEYRHDQIKDIRYGCPPEEVPSTPTVMNAYLDLFAVRYVVTVHDDWKRFLRADPARFQEMLSIRGDDSTVTLFTVRHPASVFLRGRGSVRSDMNTLDVTLENPAEEAVIKYNWVEGLSSPEAELYPFEAGQGVRLIGIRPHGASPVHIRFRRWL